MIDHTVVGATDVNNSGKTFVQDITMDSAGHVTAIGSTAVSGIDNADISLVLVSMQKKFMTERYRILSSVI